MSGRFERKQEKKPLGLKKVTLTIALAVLLLLVAGIIAGVVYYNSMLGKMDQVVVPPVSTTAAVPVTTAPAETTEATTAAPTEPPHVPSSADYINILVVGQAARQGESERYADTMILCTLNTYEKTLTLTSMLRDTLVQQPTYWNGHTFGSVKLTTVYHNGSTYGDGVAGSMEFINQTLYNNFGVEVDYNFEIDFDAFIQVIDLMQGITIDLTEAEAQYLNDADFWIYYDVTPGPFHLDGTGALVYARMRKAEGDGDSDIKRTERQRKVINAVINRARELTIPQLQDLANAILPTITTSMTNAQITQTLLTLIPMLPELSVETGGTCPANYRGEMLDIYKDGMMHSVLRFNVDETKKYMRAITEGEIG